MPPLNVKLPLAQAAAVVAAPLSFSMADVPLEEALVNRRAVLKLAHDTIAVARRRLYWATVLEALGWLCAFGVGVFLVIGDGPLLLKAAYILGFAFAGTEVRERLMYCTIQCSAYTAQLRGEEQALEVLPPEGCRAMLAICSRMPAAEAYRLQVLSDGRQFVRGELQMLQRCEEEAALRADCAQLYQLSHA